MPSSLLDPVLGPDPDPLTVPAPLRPRTAARRVLPALDHPRQVLEHLTPNWFASVMGTGIVANAAATLPRQSPPLHAAALAVWVLAAGWLVTLTTGFAVHWARHRDTARRYARDPVMSQFYGAPAMALLTVGAGAALLGRDLVGPSAALAVFVALWVAGTALGLATAVWVPFRMITAPDHTDVAALPAWLMPVVPPMVSASTGALLPAHLPPGQLRMTVLLACYAMFGLSLVTGLLTIGLVYGHLVGSGPLPTQAAPTIWITLGVIGQSVTAVNLLAAQAPRVLPDVTAGALRAFGILYGLAMGGFGALMFVLATALTGHAARRGLRFSLTWWSFTFPVGTCVTGASAVGAALGSVVVQDLAVALYGLLVVAWGTVAAHTLRGMLTGRVFLPTVRPDLRS